MERHDVMSPDAIKEAALRPLKPSGWRFWSLTAVLTALCGLAVVAYLLQVVRGLGSAGYADDAFWGIYEANLVAFIGVSYGGAVISAMLRLTEARWRAPITRLAEAMALISLLIGALFAIIHLGRPERMWRVFLDPHISSPIIWDAVAITSYLILTTIFLYLPLIPDVAVLRDQGDTPGWRRRLYGVLALRWQGLPAQRRLLARATTVVALLIIPLAVLVHSVLSWAFAVNSRPGWNSTIFAPYFVIAALFSGVAMVILIVAAFRWAYGLQAYIGRKHFVYLGALVVTLDLLYLYFTFTEMLTEGYTLNEEITPILTELLVGRYAAYFWLFIVSAGIIPILIFAIPRTRTIHGIVFASSLIVAGMWLKRILIVVPAVANPLIAGAWGSFHPTWIAVAITVGAAAGVPLLLMLFFKFFPILAIYEMEELHAGEEPGSRSAHGLVGEPVEGGLVS